MFTNIKQYYGLHVRKNKLNINFRKTKLKYLTKSIDNYFIRRRINYK